MIADKTKMNNIEMYSENFCVKITIEDLIEITV